ncbi:CLOCK-interacting pacemaker isoform X2 [Dunckerocampus dactyliophorus]|nr:CLOCK-interacting pacemaker isoform X2 [Dunckerocampus dactyliophorus]XP_054618450.1 CLOCK-interacting pacemaker isoform X2 [Dunckerocampus dactyliophorus]
MLMIRECQAPHPQPQQQEETMSTKRKADSDSKAASRPRIMKSHGNSRADSERDSGFSDASSEHMSTMDTTDSEDSPRPFVQPGPPTSASGPLAMVRGSYSSISPMIIMNNVLLKQPGDNPPAMKPWGFRPAVEVVQPVVQQPQVVFLQPVVSRQASPATKEASRHRRPKKYLPILKSYPKIAPYPGDSSSSGRGTASSVSSSSGSERGSASASGHRDHCQREKQQKSQSGRSGNSGHLSGTPNSTLPLSRLPQTSNRSETPSPAVSRSDFTPSPSLSNNLATLDPREDTSPAEQKHEDSGGDDDTRRKRFCNTYNILSKSGLLDITLRTKELLRQNRRTQTDLDRLREHTDLFLQAVRSGDAGICVKLHSSLQEEEEGGDKERERAAVTGSKAD